MTDAERLSTLVEGLLRRDADAHAEATAALADEGDVAVYDAPPAPIERRGSVLADGEGTERERARDRLRAASGETRERIPGRHGLWFAFRTHYETAHVIRE